MGDSGINSINLVCLTTADQDASIAFYVDKLGLEKRTDIPMGEDYRWVEVYPRSGTAGLALAPAPPGREAGGMQTGVTLTTDDVDATHAALKQAGVDVDAEVSRMGDPVPPMFWLRDPDANVLMVVQTPQS